MAHRAHLTLIASIIATAPVIAQESSGPERRYDGVTEPLRATPAPRVDLIQPGLTSGRDWIEALARDEVAVPRARLLPEGAFLLRRSGRVVRVFATMWVFVPDPDDRSEGEGPMLLLPSRTLERFEHTIDDEDRAPVSVSGQVLVYHGQNYLVPTSLVRQYSSEETESEDPGAATEDDPAVADLINQLSRERGRPRGITPQDGSRTTLATAPVPEGTYLSRRRCRLRRGTSGEWMIRFDSDEDIAASGSDASLVVLPCTLLERLERRAGRLGEGFEVLVSGRVLAYRGQSYLLPTLYQLPYRRGIHSMR